ncbi:MAG: zinc ribbon domain-containing protein [Gammaproteobacteria bacterium]|nr:zinc ribbon domain-containing protein [Gammaproteobacteria bacterium]
MERVNPASTSQACAQCGTLPDSPIGLEVRMYACKSCGWERNRDVNAAKNILSVGLKLHGPGGAIPARPEDENWLPGLNGSDSQIAE